jgi:hypothetical protein
MWILSGWESLNYYGYFHGRLHGCNNKQILSDICILPPNPLLPCRRGLGGVREGKYRLVTTRLIPGRTVTSNTGILRVS